MEGTRNKSKQRSAVYNALCHTTAHPTADDLFNTVRAEIPDISRGTVYRNLAVLESDGLIRNIGVVNGQARYDARTDRHAHFICRCCGRVCDLDMEQDTESMFTEISDRYGFHADTCNLTFYGLCDICREASGDQ